MVEVAGFGFVRAALRFVAAGFRAGRLVLTPAFAAAFLGRARRTLRLARAAERLRARVTRFRDAFRAPALRRAGFRAIR